MGKSVVIAILAIMFAVLMAGCVHNVSSDLASDLQEKHSLRKMFEKDVNYSESSSSWGGGFFLFLGGAEGSSQSSSGTVTMIRFAWEDGRIYTISDFPLNKIKVKIVDDDIKPTVQFFIKSDVEYTGDYDYLREEEEITKKLFDDNQERFWKNYLSYALITCSAKDWPEDIHLPMNDP